MSEKIFDALNKSGIEFGMFSCNGANVYGDAESLAATAEAFHSHSQIDELRRNLRHWRDECGKLRAQLARRQSQEG